MVKIIFLYVHVAGIRLKFAKVALYFYSRCRLLHDCVNVQAHLRIGCLPMRLAPKHFVMAKLKIIFLISQPKHLLWVLKRTVMIRKKYKFTLKKFA